MKNFIKSFFKSLFFVASFVLIVWIALSREPTELPSDPVPHRVNRDVKSKAQAQIQSTVSPPKVTPLEYPKSDLLRDEVATHPHNTPLSLLKFAAVLSSRVADAEASESAAIVLQQELTDCVRNTNLTLNLRTLCLVDAARIPSFHPQSTQIAENGRRLAQTAPEDASRLAELYSKL